MKTKLTHRMRGSGWMSLSRLFHAQLARSGDWADNTGAVAVVGRVSSRGVLSPSPSQREISRLSWFIPARRVLAMAATLLVIGICFGAQAGEPPVAFLKLGPAEPPETGPLIYAPVAPVLAGATATGRFWVEFKVENQGMDELRLNKVTLNFSVGVGGFSRSFVRDMPIAAGGQANVALSLDEVVALSPPMPGSVQILVYFKDNPTPKSIQRGLIPYAPETADGRYLFPADEGDIGPEEYFATGNIHGPGGQFWGADWSVHRIRTNGGHTSIKENGSSKVNEDRVGWGVPIRAMADGIVMRTSLGWIDNPRPGARAFQLMQESDGEPIQEVKVKRLNDTRAVSVVRLSDNAVQATIWDVSNGSRTLTRRISSDLVPGERAVAIALEVIDDGKFVTSLRLENGTHRFVVWEIQNKDDVNTMQIVRGPHYDDIAVTEVSLSLLSGSIVASAVRTAAGRLRLAAFDANAANPLLTSLTSEGASFVGATGLGERRFASSFRAVDGRLKVMAWDLVGESPYSLSPLDEAVDEVVSRVSASRNSGGKWVTAARTSPGGLLKLTRWYVTGGEIKSELMTTTATAIQDVALDVAPSKGIHVTTAALLGAGVFGITLWGDQTDEGVTTFENSAENIAGAVDRISLDEIYDADYVVGTRAANGLLKVMLWHYGDGGGNSVYVLHGNCQVKYFHFMAGSVNTNVIFPGARVRAGQVLGHMGNSGASGGAHTHIHSERLWPMPSEPEIFAAIASQTTESLPIAGTRPVPFSWARVMSLGLLQRGGETVNQFSTANGQGSFEAQSLAFRPQINTLYIDPVYLGFNRAGRKEGFAARLGEEGGPFASVASADAAAVPKTRLYIRGGNYDEALLLAKPMIVKRYNFYSKEGSAIIGR